MKGNMNIILQNKTYEIIRAEIYSIRNKNARINRKQEILYKFLTNR